MPLWRMDHYFPQVRLCLSMAGRPAGARAVFELCCVHRAGLSDPTEQMLAKLRVDAGLSSSQLHRVMLALDQKEARTLSALGVRDEELPLFTTATSVHAKKIKRLTDKKSDELVRHGAVAVCFVGSGYSCVCVALHV